MNLNIPQYDGNMSIMHDQTVSESESESDITSPHGMKLPQNIPKRETLSEKPSKEVTNWLKVVIYP